MVISDARHRECSNLTEARKRNIYAILITMCPPSDLCLHIVGTNEPKSALCVMDHL